MVQNGYGSKNRYQNGTVVSGNIDQNLRNPSSLILSHCQMPASMGRWKHWLPDPKRAGWTSGLPFLWAPARSPAQRLRADLLEAPRSLHLATPFPFDRFDRDTSLLVPLKEGPKGSALGHLLKARNTPGYKSVSLRF